jgi:hypothetical protein
MRLLCFIIPRFYFATGLQNNREIFGKFVMVEKYHSAASSRNQTYSSLRGGRFSRRINLRDVDEIASGRAPSQ